MNWNNPPGHIKIKQKLKESITDRRISHAQLFSGKNGWGALQLALSYAAEILASEKGEAVKKRVMSLQHPDLHMTFPVTSMDNIKEPKSVDFIKQFREFWAENPYGSLYEWFEFLEVEKKRGIINVHETADIGRFLALNSYEGSYKFCIIWLPEMMNPAAANKLLKNLEEPPAKTVFLLVTEREDLLLPTIISRCQLVKLNRLSDEEVTDYLIENKGIAEEKAIRVAKASGGNLREAEQNLDDSDKEFESYFIDWVRNAFMAAKNPKVLKNLIGWSQEISVWPREKQSQFLRYCSEVFRLALLQNYKADSLVYMEPGKGNLNWEAFSKYIHGANIKSILEELNDASYHIERNANGKIVLLDLAIRLTRHLHRKAG